MNPETVVVRLVADTLHFLGDVRYATARFAGYMTAMATSVARSGVEMATTFERNSVAIKTMVGDAETGAKLIADLTQLAIDTPFSSQEVVQAAKQLKAFGFETSQIIDTVKSLGNVSAGTGTSIDRIILAFGQVRVAGKLMGTELRQFTDAGIPLMENLAKVMGKPQEAIRKLVEQGAVGFDDVVAAFNRMNAAGGTFAGLMDVISKQTVAGRWQAFKETLDVMSRNFATAAMEGLGLKFVLGDATAALQEMNKGDGQGGTMSFFADMRTVVSGIATVLKQVGKFVGDVYRQVRTWLKENQAVAQTVVAIAATVWTLYLAIKTVTFAIAAMRMALMAVYALSGIMSLVSAFASLVSLVGAFMTTIGTLILWVVPIVVVFGTIAGLLKYMGAFKFSGVAFSQGLEAMQGMGDVLGRIVKLLRSGDLEGAWELVTVGFLYAWRVMVLTMKAEFAAAMRGLGDAAPAWMAALFTRESIATVEKGRKARADVDRQEMEAQATAAKHGLSMFSAYELNAWQDILNKERANADTLTKQLTALKNDTTGFGAGPGGLISIAKWEQEIKDSISAQLKSNQFIADIMKRAGTENFTAVGNPIMNDPIAKQRRAEIDRLMAKTATALPTSFGEVIGRAIMMSVAGSGGELAKMAQEFGISGRARTVFNDVAKEFEEGITSWEKEVKRMQAVNEAYYGSKMGQNVAAAAGGLALAGKMGGPMSDDMRRFEDFNAYERIKKAAGEYKPPPLAAAGSQQAQDIVNANLTNQRTTQEEVLATLQASKELHRESVAYQKEVADAMKALREKGLLKALGLE